MADSTEPRAQLHDTSSPTMRRTSPLVTTMLLPLLLCPPDPFSSACCRHSQHCRCHRQHPRHMNLHCVGRLPDFELLADLLSCDIVFMRMGALFRLKAIDRGRHEASCEFPSTTPEKGKKRTVAGLRFTLVTVHIRGFLAPLSGLGLIV